MDGLIVMLGIVAIYLTVTAVVTFVRTYRKPPELPELDREGLEKYRKLP